MYAVPVAIIPVTCISEIATWYFTPSDSALSDQNIHDNY